MQDQDLGYNKEQVLVVRAAAIFDSTYMDHIRYFKNELMRLPAVAEVAGSGEIPGQAIGDRNSVKRLNADEEDKQGTYILSIDDDFINTLGMKLVAGRNFNESDRFVTDRYYRGNIEKLLTDDGFFIGGGQNKILVNEVLANRLGFEKPEDAIDQIVKFKLGPEYAGEIVGVVKNYHQLSLKQNYEPTLFFFWNYGYKYFSIRMNTRDLHGTIDRVKGIYAAAFPNNAFEYFFLDEHFERQYQNDLRFARLFGLFTILAIVIACLGLLGLGVYSVTQRTKEIGIRKALGASSSGILVLFSRDSVMLVMISYLISLPLTYFAVQSWLSNFAFHVGLLWQMFLFPPLFLLAISVATITFVCLRAALGSPVVALRHE
jgi:putative ABC transport system permease protein